MADLSTGEIKDTLEHMLGLMTQRAIVDEGIQADRRQIRFGLKLQAGEAKSFIVGSTIVTVREKDGDYQFELRQIG
jgi:hypothetical protein